MGFRNWLLEYFIFERNESKLRYTNFLSCKFSGRNYWVVAIFSLPRLTPTLQANALTLHLILDVPKAMLSFLFDH